MRDFTGAEKFCRVPDRSMETLRHILSIFGSFYIDVFISVLMFLLEKIFGKRS